MPFAYSRHEIPNGVAGTMATVGHIVKLIRQGTNYPAVREIAARAVQSVRWRDKYGEAERIFNWIRQNIRFTYDPEGAEMLQRVDAILEHRAADCDDFVILGGSLLRSIGIPVRIVIIGADPSAPDGYSHIYLQAFMGDAWVGFDPSVNESKFGWEPPRFTVKRVIPVED